MQLVDNSTGFYKAQNTGHTNADVKSDTEHNDSSRYMHSLFPSIISDSLLDSIFLKSCQFARGK